MSGDINYLAVVLAAAASWVAGAAWYGALSKPWLAAVEKTKEDLSANSKAPPWLPFAVSFVLEVVMAYAIARFCAAADVGSALGGLAVGALAWVGVALPVTATNYIYPGRKPMLTVIDSGHWLAVLLIQGAVIGALGA